jgi:branched-subunit amino acid ABC-type transport system permease component
MMVICAILLLVVGSVLGIYLMRFTINPLIGGTLGQICASVANALIIQLLNQVFLGLATELTEWENHRTETEVSCVVPCCCAVLTCFPLSVFS